MSSPDQLDVNDVMKYMREVAGERDQEIAMLRAALAKATTPPAATADVTGPPPVPDPD